MKDTIILHNEIFTVMKPIKPQDFYGRTLLSCYEKPSIYKQGIYNEWVEWSKHLNIKNFGISSYNGFIFTLGGIIHDYFRDIHGFIYITKTRQEFYPFS